ncbi:MAG TPA: cytochrome c oxidase assembly protein [Acidimicrobiales bacterium]|nr:cytochrome c oxidase assembly protein [Acidimicrobiales bacterium]
MPEFHPHFDVIGLVASLIVGYVVALRRLGPTLAARRNEPVYERKHIARFVLAIALLFAFSYWPIHDWAEGYLFSVHMTQHTVFSLIAPPILLLSLPPWLLDWLTSPPWLRATLKRVCRPLPAALMFNGITAVSHWPAWVDLSLRSELFHFTAHLILWTTASAMWLPVINPGIDGLPSLSRMAKMPYLFLQSIVPTIPASFLAFADNLLYARYGLAPRITSMSAIEDQQLAGGIMKIGGTVIIWGVIVVIFFRWYADSERTGRDTLTWDDVEQEFARTPPAKSEAPV